MNRESFRGLKSVFTFTFAQYVKGKSFKIICIILSLIALASFPVLSLIKEMTTEKEISISYDKVYVTGANENWINALEKVCDTDELLKDVQFILSDKTLEEYETELEKEKTENYIAMSIDATIPMITIIYGGDTEVDDGQAGYLSDHLYFNSVKLTALAMGIDENAFNALELEIYGDFSVVKEEVMDDEDTEGDVVYIEKEEFSMKDFGIAYGFIIVIMLFVVFSGEAVAMSIITEKSSKVVEYLMVSIKPLALILGKVAAMLCAVTLQLSVCGVCILISSVVNGFIFTNPDGSYGGAQVIEGILELASLKGLNPVNLIVAVAVLLLGIVGYGLLAGVAGATVSKVEEAAEGMKIFTFTLLIGMYLCMIYINILNTGGDWGIYGNIPYLLPVSAPFIVPTFLLMGKISLATALIAAVILVVAIILLTYFVSSVYEYLIYHRGEPVRFKQLIAIAKANSKKNKNDEKESEYEK